MATTTASGVRTPSVLNQTSSRTGAKQQEADGVREQDVRGDAADDRERTPPRAVRERIHSAVSCQGCSARWRIPLTISSSPQTASPAATRPGKESPARPAGRESSGNACTWTTTTTPSSRNSAPKIASLIFMDALSDADPRGPSVVKRDPRARGDDAGSSGARRARAPCAVARRHLARPTAFITTPMLASPLAMNVANSGSGRPRGAVALARREVLPLLALGDLLDRRRSAWR